MTSDDHSMLSPLEQAARHFDAGMAHARKQEFAAAAEAFRLAAEANPGHANTHSNLGSSLAAIGRHEEAAEAFRRAIALDPNHAQAHFNLGASLRELGQREEAFACFARTLQIDPRHEEAYFNLGREHQFAGRQREALASYILAAEFNPNERSIHAAMADLLVQMREPGAAARAFEKLLSFNPDDSMTRASLMDQLARDGDWERLEPLREWIPTLGVEAGPVPPFGLLTFDDNPDRNLARSCKFAETFPSVRPLTPRERPSDRPKRLRIGYFSADFHNHATMALAARMFELHDRERFAVHAYSYGAEISGDMRERACAAFEIFRDVRELRGRAIAELARADGIDVAVDLKGYTEFQRLGILAYRPAPIQMTYLGYPGSLCLPFIDYLIADRTVVPVEHRKAYSEKLIYLPHSYQANDDCRFLPERRMNRAEAGLPDEGFVFCCFNHSYKITPAEFRIWLELLKEVEGSVLWLLASPGKIERNLRQVMSRHGVDQDRLIIAPRTDMETHLTRLGCADLFLDTFNYNAHTTASDALWVGLPVVTKMGRGFPARVAASLLRAVGLDELITTDEGSYAELALSLARDKARLAAIRAKLEGNRATAPLFDSARLTRHLQAGFDLAYQRYLDGLAPADIAIEAS